MGLDEVPFRGFLGVRSQARRVVRGSAEIRQIVPTDRGMRVGLHAEMA